MEGGAGAGGILQTTIDKFTRVMNKLAAAVDGLDASPTAAIPVPPLAPAGFTPMPGVQRGNAGGSSITPQSGGFTPAGIAGTVAAGFSGGMVGGLARTALSYAPAPVSAAVSGLAAAGTAAQPSQLALNTLQYQSSIFGQSYQTTRLGAMGTAGNLAGGQRQVQWGLNPADMAATYASLQQTTAQVNPYATGPGSLGAANVLGTMGGMNIANPAMSGVQNAQAVAQLYAPQTSMNMAMMGYGRTPDQAGTGAHGTFADTMAPLLNRLGNGKSLTQQQLMSQLAPGQKGNVDLTNLTGGNPTEVGQFASQLSIQNALMTGVNGQPKMTLDQVDKLFSTLASGSGSDFSKAEATLQQYGVSQSAIQMLKSKAGNQAQGVSDTSSGYMTAMQDSTRALSDFNTILHKIVNEAHAGGFVGWMESTTANILGGGSATMYDSTVPDQAPTTMLPGTSAPLMIAYYVSAFAAPTKSKFPSGTQFVTIDQRGNHTEADVVDMESGAVFPASAVNAWLKKAGGSKVVYATPSNKAALDATKPPAYQWWAAEWNNSQSVPAGAVAHQFKSGGSYDTSVVSNPGAFNGKGGGASPAAAPASGGGTSTTTTSSFTPSSPGGLSAGLGDYETEGSTEEISAFNAAIIGGALGGGGGSASTTTTTTAAATPGAAPAGATPAGGGKTMYDSQYPSIFPKNADLVVSYVDGPQASNFGQAQSIFGSKALSITWTGENADIADVETAFPLSKLPAWIDAQHARGIPKPVVYAIYSGVGTNYASVKQAVGTKSVSYWLSDWTGKPHTLPGADAVQYGAQASPSSPMITNPANAGGKTYDLSFVSSSFPYYGGAPKLTPPAGHSQQEVPKFTYTPPIPSTAGITVHFPAGSINAKDPAAAATRVAAQVRAELVRLGLVSN